MSSPDPTPDPQPTPSPEPAPDPTPEPSAPAADTRWYDSLGPDLQHAHFERFPAEDLVPMPKALAKSYVEAHRHMSMEKMPVPREDWSDSDWEAHYERLGVPKVTEGANPVEVYGLSRPDDLPEDLPVDTEMEQRLVGLLAEAKLTPAQAEKVYEGYFNLIGENWKELSEGSKAATEKGIQELKDTWGGNFGARVNLAHRAMLESVGGDQAKADALRTLPLADGTLLGDHPAVIAAFSALGAAGAEHGFISDTSGGPGAGFSMTAEEAARKYREVQTRFEKMNRIDPDYKATADEMDRLLKIAGDKIHEF